MIMLKIRTTMAHIDSKLSVWCIGSAATSSDLSSTYIASSWEQMTCTPDYRG